MKVHTRLVTYLSYVGLNPDWVVDKAVSSENIPNRYGNHWSSNFRSVFRIHTVKFGKDKKQLPN